MLTVLNRCLFFSGVTALSAATLPNIAQAQDNLRVIVRAFIPKSHPTQPDAIRPVPGEPGKFMLGDVVPSGLCFDTDHREFSSDPNASARLATDITFVLGNPVTVKPTSGVAHSAGATVRRKCATGGEVKIATASVSACSVGAPAIAEHLIQVVLGCSAGNPLVPGAPKIDYSGTLTYDSATKSLAFQATVGNFPSFEAYASLNNKPFKRIFAVNPMPGSSPLALFDGGMGFQSRPLTKTFVKLE